MFTNDIERARFNEKFSEAIASGSFGKFAAEMSPYIKVRVYEQSVCTAILRTRTVTPADLIPEPGYNDTFYVFGQLDQPTRDAIAVNFRGQSTDFYPGGRRFKIPIGRHVTKTTRKNEDELKAWDYDLFADLAEKDIFELHTLRDKKFLWACHAGAITTGRWKEYALSGAATVVRPDKIHFTENAQLIEAGSRIGYPDLDTLKATKHLMGSQLWHDLNLWESEGAGGELVSQITIEGYPATKIMGISYLQSIKNQLYVERDPVIALTMTGVGTDSETITVDGIVYTWKDSPAGEPGDREMGVGTTAATAATAVYDKLVEDQGYTGCLGDNYVFSNPSAGVVHVRKIYDADWNRFSPPDMVIGAGAITNGSWGTQSYDYWDHIYTYPDPEYIGEIVQIQGQEIEVDLWKERGEKNSEILRRSSEFSGGAIGNINGVAIARLQRADYSG